MKIFKIFLAPLDFIMKYFKALVFLLVVFLIFSAGEGKKVQNANLARVDLSGMIIESESFLKEVQAIEQDNAIKGVLLVVNSPGGAIAPSVEIAEAIKRLKSKKPVVAYAQGVMASGSYMAGMWADSIVANKGSLLGSIGVIIEGVDISPLLDKIGIKSQTLKAGIYKEAGTFAREWSKEEEGLLKDLVEEQYRMFVEDVALARGLKVENENEFAQGRIMSANTALKLGLIDEVGDIYKAQEKLKELAKISNPIWLEKEEDFFNEFLGQSISKGIASGILNAYSKVYENLNRNY
ncbi:endopeptidase IV [Helicobacter valdiviensis]|uniref:Endopeptidase IV n=1 Tax=Helicobacter valdiviensis TaxID=1458358 RepID=A0A2W6MSZ7_9HELI|nr:signal peptide peptidase SppA [Helicobacter valdiviensis]PZT47674.1 endopeptidase IV [Helicobacter valdiviensis]